MSLVGFKQVKIGILGEDDKVTKTFTINGETNKGATVDIEINGFDIEPITQYGSDVAYYVLSQGATELDVNMSVLDLPDEVLNAVLGQVEGEDGISWSGENTIAPYVALLAQSQDPQGNDVYFGLPKGKFSTESVKANTKEKDPKELEADALKGKFVTKQIDGEARVFGKGKGAKALAAFEKALFKTAGTSPKGLK